MPVVPPPAVELDYIFCWRISTNVCFSVIALNMNCGNLLILRNCPIPHYVILPLHCHQVSNLELFFSSENNLNLAYFYTSIKYHNIFEIHLLVHLYFLGFNPCILSIYSLISCSVFQNFHAQYLGFENTVSISVKDDNTEDSARNI